MTNEDPYPGFARPPEGGARKLGSGPAFSCETMMCRAMHGGSGPGLHLAGGTA